jgi:dihydroxy-acid dehydratase
MSNRFSTFPTYQKAIAKVHLGSCGVDQKKLDKPIIAIVNSWNEIVTGHVHLRILADQVKQAITEAGAVPLEFNTIAICDGIAQGHAGMKYSLASRELIADSIEAMVKGHGIFDGMVMLGSCDKIVPGMLMAAARINIPTIMITGGPMKHHITPKENKAARQEFIHGKIDEQKLLDVSAEYYTGAGVCPFFGTANTMCEIAETLGLTLPNVSTVLALSDEQKKLTAEAGRTIVNLVKKDIKPLDILTKEAFENAITVTLAMGGSLNSTLHIPAIAAECGIPISLDDFDRISRSTPLNTRICPNSKIYATGDLDTVGGLKTVMNELRSILHTDCLTVNGHTIGENIADAKSADGEIIRPITNPFEREGGIAVLYGNLAPKGSVVKCSAIPENQWIFEGPAMVFDSEEDCTDAAYAHQIPNGTAVIIRYEGPSGGPGMREMHRATEILAGIPGVAIITDGRFSGASAGISVGYLSPEAYAGGPIGLVQNGDIIKINIPERKLEWCVSEDTAAKRRTTFQPVIKDVNSNFLHLYREISEDASKGAVRKKF